MSNCLACVLSFLVLLLPPLASAERLPLEQIRLPPGFVTELFARAPNVREMALGRQTLFVGSMAEGKVGAIPLHDGKPGQPQVVVSGLELPVGVAFRDGDLYVSAVSRILRLRDIKAHLDRPQQQEVVSDRYPTESHHGWKFIAFGPDGWLYVGDDVPPDELNRLDRPGRHFGYPYCHGAALADPEFGADRDCRSLSRPDGCKANPPGAGRRTC